MQARSLTWEVAVRGTTALAVMFATCLVAGLGASPTGKNDPPKPLPDDIVKEWKKAGAQVGWMRETRFFGLNSEAEADDLPAFSFSLSEMKEGGLEKLPQPKAPFGLLLRLTMPTKPVMGKDAAGNTTFTPAPSLGQPKLDAALKQLGRFGTLETLSIDMQLQLRLEPGLKQLAGLKSLRTLSVSSATQGDPWMKHLTRLKSLQTLSISGAGLSDGELNHVAGLKNLQTLTLSSPYITGSTFKELAGLKSLRTLNLSGCGIGRGGLKRLVGLSGLETLNLKSCGALGDAELKELAGLRSLQSLDVRFTNVTGAGVAELLKALPNCKIEGPAPIGAASDAAEEPLAVKELAILKGSSPVVSLAFSADGSRLVAAGFEQDPSDMHKMFSQAIVWDVAKEQKICTCRNPSVGEVDQRIGGPAMFLNAWLTADGRTVITRNLNAYQFWDGTTGKPLGSGIPSAAGKFTARALSPDGAYFAVASNQRESTPVPLAPFRIGDIVVYDRKARKVKWKLTGEMGIPPHMEPGNSNVETRMTQEEIRRAVANFEKSHVAQLAFSPEGNQLAALGGSGVRVFSLDRGKEGLTLQATWGPGQGYSAYDEDLHQLAPAFFWVDDGLIIRSGNAPTAPVTLFDPATGKIKDRSALSADGKWLKSAHLTPNVPPELVIWDIARERQRGMLQLPKDHFFGGPAPSKVSWFGGGPLATSISGGGYKLPVAISPDGKRVAVLDTSGAVHVFDAAQIEANTKSIEANPPTGKPAVKMKKTNPATGKPTTEKKKPTR